MDKNAIKKFAVWARRELLERVAQRAMRFGIEENKPIDEKTKVVTGYVLTDAEYEQRRMLIYRIRKNEYRQVMEEAAYTWFNRFIALRFMEVNGYLPSRVRVFSNESGAFDPQILAEALHVDLYGLDIEKVYELEESDQKEALFKYLLITQCNDLSRMLPGLFERIADYTELLFPDNLLREGSVIEQMVTTIPEDDWRDAVQIIGWLYQYYNAEPKDQVFADLKKNIKISKEKIPAATQLFTPDWIVRYMVENSLGRLWIDHLRAVEDSGTLDLSAHSMETEMGGNGVLNIKSIGEFAIKDNWKYYLDEAPQEPEVEAQLREIRAQYAQLDPSQILCCDPCMGSGHILVYMFDVLMQIYLSCGWTTNEAVESIVRNNLWGMDIDDRAAQLAYFAVMMKAQQYDNRWLAKQLKRSVQPNVFALQDSPVVDEDFYARFGEHADAARRVMEAFQDAKEYGSIIQPNVTLEELDQLEKVLIEQDEMAPYGSLATQIAVGETINAMSPMIPQTRALVQKYHVVVTNPPYMGAGGMNGDLSNYVRIVYPDSKSDMSTVCMEQCLALCVNYGYIAMINIPVWMFISSYEKLRYKLLDNCTYIDMIHPGRGIFGSDFGTTTFVFSNYHIPKYCGVYCRLFDKQGEVVSVDERELAYLEGKGRYVAKQDMFAIIPGAPVGYWVNQSVYNAFSIGVPIGKVSCVSEGIKTADNERFLRLWFEVSIDKFSMRKASSGYKWYPHHKGGDYRKWYGNYEWAINWEDNGKEIKSFPGAGLQGQQMYFGEFISGTKISSRSKTMRYFENNTLFDSGAPTLSNSRLKYTLALLTSKVGQLILGIISPTLNMQVGDIKKVPILLDKEEIITLFTENCIYLSKKEWDSFETSWDFQMHPIVKAHFENEKYLQEGLLIGRYPNSIRDCFLQWSIDSDLRFAKLKSNEEELNRIFIDIYGLQDELTPEVEDKDVTVRKADLGRDIRSLISYAVGCMFGRYSIDEPGLILAGQKYSDKFVYASVPVAGGDPLFTVQGDCYLVRGKNDVVRCTFVPDQDGILPITDDEYFDDDIVFRFVEWVRTVFGADTLEDNLKFIADALPGKGTPREVIRQYFLNDFYKDHLKVYQKRPIYWLFDSGKKNGFKCLIYMHRYQPDTLARIRTDYLHELQGRYRNAIDTLDRQIAVATTSERVKLQKRLASLKAQAEEARVYEEKIHHLADQMIKIDLDDGVKHNYAIFKDVLAPIK